MIYRIYNFIKKKIVWFLMVTGIIGTALAMGMPADMSFEHLPNVVKEATFYKIQYPDTGEVEIPKIDKPTAKLKKWNGEVSMNIKLRTDKKVKAKQENGKLKRKDNDKEVHLYPLGI